MKVLEKLRNKKILMMYLIGVLLLSFGASFAYFLATSSVTGEGVIGTNVTTTIEADGVVANGNIGFNNVDIYPGHKEVASIKVTGKGDNKPLMFDVIFNGSNTFHTPLNYTIYELDSDIDVSFTCEKKTGNVNNGKTYYEECTGNNIEQLGAAIGTGTITNGEGIQELVNDELIVTSPNGTEIYYYIVIEYPNLDNSQNEDMGASISGKITIQEGNKYQAPELLITENLTSGNNGWYRGATLTTNITTQTGNYQAEYCITSDETCIPDQTASITDNSFDVTLDSNSAHQKLCVRVTDEYNQIGEGCSNSYNVDSTNPSISITSSEVTENSISITVSGIDVHSGIYQYRFSSNNGNSYTDVTTSDSSYTYIFENLDSGTSYNIVVQIIDKAGNIGSASQAIETDSTKAKDIILGNTTIHEGSPNFENTSTTNEGMYIGQDDWGISYYFRGAVDNNWVYFAGYYWRIIRINGDESVRLIYNGTNTSTGTNTQINLVDYTFNDSYNRSEYVGYKYTSGQQHGNLTDSSIKITIDGWYNNNLKKYEQYLSKEAGFCGDREMASGYDWEDRPNETIYYAADERVGQNSTSAIPTLKCTNYSDLYTTSESSKGNKVLTYPIGLITADEMIMAGGSWNDKNEQYYLYTGRSYWTMTPQRANSSGWAGMFLVGSNGYLDRGWVNDPYGVRPVINLKADVKLTGSGTSTDPYRVS